MSDAATFARSSAPVRVHPFEAILRLCAESAPKPWYPRLHAQEAGIPLEMLYYYLENLWLDGLVQKVEGTPQTGPGLTLAPLGRDVLNDPEALQRLRDGRPVVEGSQGGIVREVIRRPPRPTVTWGLVAVSLAVFACGLVLAMVQGIGFEAFLFGGGRAVPVLETLGVVRGEDWLRGEWWRLATSSFVSVGIFNLAFSLLALYRIGGRAEQMWGRGRFLLLYLLSGMGGSCVGIAMQPQAWPDGSWGATCGLIGATAVWVLCNHKHLPRAVASRMRTQLAVDALLLGFFSVMLGRWDDLGGAFVGAAVALVLHVQRFGPWPWNWAILAVLLPLPWLGYTFIEHERHTNPEWAEVEAEGGAKQEVQRKEAEQIEKEMKEFETSFLSRIRIEAGTAYQTYCDKGGVLGLPPEKRKDGQVDKVKHDLGEQLDVVKQLGDDLAAAGPYKGEVTENARQKAIRYVQTLNDLLTTAVKRLREGTEWTAADELKAGEVKATAQEWHKVLKPS